MTSSKIRPGQIWLTYLRFLVKPETGKVRPVLILDEMGDAVLIAAKITSQSVKDDGMDVPIHTEWQKMPKIYGSDPVLGIVSSCGES